MDAFISVYGNPVPGGSSLQGDVWRDGPQLSAPTYAAYAAQAWLASRTSPVNIVRLLGDEHDQATGTAGNAGWQLSASVPSSASGSNSTAYGLFVVDKAKAANLTYVTVADVGGLGDGDTLTIDDGTNAAVIFEYDTNGSVTGTNIAVAEGGDGPTRIANFAAKIAVQVAAGKLNVAVDTDGTSTIRIATLETSSGTIARSSGAIQLNGNGALASVPLAAADVAVGEGALAAIFYVDSGYLALEGRDGAGAAGEIHAETIIESNEDNIGFTLQVYDASGTAGDKISFNFDRNSKDYIREKFNTNPQKVNSDVTDSDDLKTYWLGESFERHLKTKVTTKVSGSQYGVLLALQKGNDASAAKSNWSYHKLAHKKQNPVGLLIMTVDPQGIIMLEI